MDGNMLDLIISWSYIAIAWIFFMPLLMETQGYNESYGSKLGRWVSGHIIGALLCVGGFLSYLAVTTIVGG